MDGLPVVGSVRGTPGRTGIWQEGRRCLERLGGNALSAMIVAGYVRAVRSTPGLTGKRVTVWNGRVAESQGD